MGEHMRGNPPKGDVMRRLREARPPELADGTRADPGRRVAELTAAMTGTPPAGAEAEPRPARQLPRLRWGIGLVGVAAAGALAVTLLPADSGAPARAGAPAPGTGPVTGRDFLLAAAERVESRGKNTTGAYWYTEERSGNFIPVPGKDGKPAYLVDDRTQNRQWLARNEHKRWSDTAGTGVRPAFAKDERAWRAAGSPKNWDLWGIGGKLKWDAFGLVAQDAPGGSGDTMPMGDISIKDVQALPTDVDKLRKRLRELVDKEYNAPEKHLRELVQRKAFEVAVHMPAGPALRAAAYRLLAEEPGVRALGEITDRSGRKGYGVGLPAWGATQQQIILDKRNGAPLGVQTVNLKAQHNREKGGILYYSTIVEQRWTNTEPPFSEDKQNLGEQPPFNPELGEFEFADEDGNDPTPE
ncbi:CU044_5270 family protein [Streptomyces sp. CAU 1734]|uniref:CU044_5270 family protein n=1 Tax=Streptomyces sp. CAU 1734 TaxID=3140360 RepID=UPI0032618048